MSETVDNDIRDEVMSKILAKPQNQICFDCGSKAPKWSSPYLGIVICYECAAKHRSYGTHISFVRSVDLDKWNRKQLKSLELTGNSYTKERFNDLGVPLIGGNYDYNNSMVLKVRQEIAEKVKESLKPDDYKKKEDKKEEKNEFDDIEINQEEKEEIKEVKEEKKDDKKKKEKKEEKEEKDEDNDNNDNKKDEEEDDFKQKEKEKEKEKELEDEGYNKSYNIKISKKELNKKLANKKAISSEDYAALEEDNTDNKVVKDRIKSMGNSQAISSEDVFGTTGESNAYEGESLTDKLKDMALNFTLSAAEKAKQLKNKTNEYINKVQNKFGGGGY